MKRLLLILLIPFIINAQTGKSVLTQAQKDSIQAMIDASVPDSSNLANYVDKTTSQIITAEKDFTGGIKLSDTTHSIYFYNPFTAPYGYYAMRSWNQWVNTDGRPDVGFALGYNIASGGGVSDADDVGMGMMIESHYDGNGYTASELHLMGVEVGGTQHRFLTADFNKTTGSVGLRLNADKIFMGEDDGSIIWYMNNGSIQYYQPYFSMYPNNSSMIANWNKDSTAWVFLPYIDNNDRYTFGNIDTVTAGNPFLHLYQLGLRFDNTYGFSSYNSGGHLTKNFYYDSDELRIQSYTGEPVKIKSSNLYFEKPDGGLVDIINPALPFDTTGLEAGEKYVDLNTGVVKMRIGESLISNGDFSSWTWDATSFRHPTGWIKQFIGDTTRTYIENVSNQLHIVSDGSARLTYLYNAASLSIGVTYVYAFNLVSYTADSLAISVGGVPINPGYSNLTAGYKTGEITATSTAMFSFDNQLSSANATIDNIRIWKKTGGNIDAPVSIYGIDSFTTTATADTITNADISASDVFMVSINDATPVADDLLSWTAETGRLIVHRVAGTTSGLSYSYMRIQ